MGTTPWEHTLLNQLRRTHISTQRLDTNPSWPGVCPRSSVSMIWLLACCFCGTLHSGRARASLTTLPAVGTLFLPLGCLVQMGNGSLFSFFTVSWYDLFVASLKPALFWCELERKWDRGKIGRDGRSGGKRYCGQEVLYESWIYFKLKKKKEKKCNNEKLGRNICRSE